MKNSLLKSFLAVAMMTTGAGCMMAADIVENWDADYWEETEVDGKTKYVIKEDVWMPITTSKTDTPTETCTSTETGISYTFHGTYLGIAYSSSNVYTYLMMKGKEVSGAYIEFTLPIDCAEIQIKTSAGCSTNARSTINVLADDESIAEALKVNEQNTVFKVPVPSEYQAAGTTFRIESNTTSYNQQFVEFTYVEATQDPSISVASEELSFVGVLGETVTKSLALAVNNYDGDVEALIVGDDADSFSVSAASFPADTKEIEVSYIGSDKGANRAEASLILAIGNVTATVTLNGSNIDCAGTEADPLSVDNVIALNNAAAGPYYVKGIIQDKCAANAKDGKLSTTETLVATNIVLKSTTSDEIIAVQLPQGDTRSTLNIVDNPTNVGQTVIVKGSLEAFFSAPGVKNTEYISGLPDSGIADVQAGEAAPAVYYNLQGVRVDNPQGGVFIRVENGRSGKVMR